MRIMVDSVVVFDLWEELERKLIFYGGWGCERVKGLLEKEVLYGVLVMGVF